LNNRDKSCDDCSDCRFNEDYCSARENLPNDIGEKFIKDGIEYTKSCPEFEWD
jgi:hypothetical protein